MKNIMWKLNLFIFFFFTLLKFLGAAETSYSYEHQNLWSQIDETCGNGKRQSPINIRTNSKRIKEIKAEIMFGNYKKKLVNPITIENNGHTVNVHPSRTNLESSPYIKSSIFPGNKFEYQSNHFHWGGKNNVGSEHRINGKQYALEMHIIHKNIKYATISEAIKHPDGLVVLAILYKGSDLFMHFNFGLSHITWYFNSLKQPHTKVKVRNYSFSLKDLLGKFNTKSGFYTYKGSLTTPPCSEAVTWIVFKHIQKISTFQLSLFRKLKDDHGGFISGNYRKIQPIGNRKIKMSKGSKSFFGIEIIKPL